MHYIKFVDNSTFFGNLKTQIIKANPCSIDCKDCIMCPFDDDTIKTLTEIISEYIWDVKFLDYVTKKVKCIDNCLREIDIIINTMNVANSFKENNNTVEKRVSEYISENKELNIEGFVNFRLRDFLNDFDNLVNFYQRSYDVEAEYFDFIYTLKECMDCFPEEQGEEVHIVNHKGISHILNSEGEDITDKCFEKYTFECSDDITRDDKIVSSLITMRPRALHLHSNKYSAAPVLYDTLKAIFACRIIVE